MEGDFLKGFAAHAHTLNELETDRSKEEELRRKNTPAEAQKLAEIALQKLETDITESKCNEDDIKLLILFDSYRGEPKDRDLAMSEAILSAIESRFRKSAQPQLRLVGHTTAGELENEDLLQKSISGVGFNGISMMALATNLPIGVARTWGLRNATEASEQGAQMARDAWIDFSQQTSNKQQLQMKKTLLLLTQGLTVDNPGYEHFLAEGVANFMGTTREARIANVIGGSSGDGLIARSCRQFYGQMKEHPHLKALEGEAVCALIPNPTEVSMGLAVDGTTRIGRQHNFYFDSEKEPHYKYVKRIGKDDACTKYAEAIYENELRLSREKGLPAPDKKAISETISAARSQQTILVFNPILGRYAFAFPFGNYACVAPMRVLENDLELILPVRNYTPEMPGYFVIGDHEKIQKGARRVYDMLRADQSFERNDVTILISCINRRIIELMAGCRSGTEAEMLKDGLSSTQVIGFLAYGELSFTQLIQEPFFHALSCWGLTLHSKTSKDHTRPDAEKEEKKDMGIRTWIKGHATKD